MRRPIRRSSAGPSRRLALPGSTAACARSSSACATHSKARPSKHGLRNGAVAMDIRADEISRILREQIKGYGKQVEVSETGTVLSTGDGIARVYGLEGVMAGELAEFPQGLMDLVLHPA